MGGDIFLTFLDYFLDSRAWIMIPNYFLFLIFYCSIGQRSYRLLFSWRRVCGPPVAGPSSQSGT